MHCGCPENELRAVFGRVIMVVPEPTRGGLALLRRTAAQLAARLPPRTATDVFAMHARYSGAKAARYLRATWTYLIRGVHKADSFCSMFVKPERFFWHLRENPDPRAIQYRGPVYCVALSQYLHPIEHDIYMYDGASKGVARSRNIAKGMNSVERAEVLVAKVAQFRDPRIISLDASRFDAHVHEEVLKIEHGVYTRVNPAREFKDLLRRQLRSTVFSKSGMRYVVRGRRMSGDMNTASGNCLLMIIMLESFAEKVALTKWDCFDDGDDCLLIVESEELQRAEQNLHQVFLTFGQEMKAEPPVSSVFEVDFCQSRIVEFAPGRVKFVRSWMAVMSKALCGIRHWQDPRYRRKVLASIAACELVLNLGVPVLQTWACAVQRSVGDIVPDVNCVGDGLRVRVNRDLKLLGLKLRNVRPQPIQWCARESFASAFGIDPTTQVVWESILDEWTFDPDLIVDRPGEVVAETWERFPSCVDGTQ